MPEESVNFPITGGYSAISEMARSLARTLQAAPAQESRRAAALRRYLLSVLDTIIQASEEWAVSGEGVAHQYNCAHLVQQIRLLAFELTVSPPAVPPGIGVVLQAFAHRFMPDALLVFRIAQRHVDFTAWENLQRCRALLKELPFPPVVEPSGLPKRFVALSYPYGEQDNALLSCVAVRYFGRELKRNGDAFATWILGPAYYFALAEEYERTEVHDMFDKTRLYSISRLLAFAGWDKHAQLGPLLSSLHTSLDLDSPDGLTPRQVEDKEAYEKSLREEWLQLQQMWDEKLPSVKGYTPEDFDRDVPRLWERLRQLLPPNDLDIDAVESAQPADEVSILNAGWSFYLLHVDDLYHILGSKTAEDRYEAKQVLNRLLTKGIELSQIARRWKEAREEA